MNNDRIMNFTDVYDEVTLPGLPRELLDQISLELGSGDIPSLARLTMTCRQLHGLWYSRSAEELHHAGAGLPLSTNGGTAGTSHAGALVGGFAWQADKSMLNKLLLTFANPRVLPALILVASTRRVRKQALQAASLAERISILSRHYSAVRDRQLHGITDNFSLEDAFQAFLVNEASQGLVAFYFHDLVGHNHFMPRVSDSRQQGPMAPLRELEGERIQRALCVYEHFRSFRGVDVFESCFSRHLESFSSIELVRVDTITEWIRERVFFVFMNHVPGFRDRRCCEDPIQEYCPASLFMRLTLSLEDFHRLMNASVRDRAPDEEVLDILDLERKLVLPSETEPGRMAPVDLRAMFSMDHAADNVEGAHEIHGLVRSIEGGWGETESLYRRSNVSTEDQFHDPDTGPVDFLRWTEDFPRGVHSLSTGVAGGDMLDRFRLLSLTDGELPDSSASESPS